MARFYSGAVAATRTESTSLRGVGFRRLVARDTLGALVVALAIPFLFLHEKFQPALEVEVGSATARLRPSDAAVLAILVAAAAVARRDGIGGLRAGRALWLAGGALLVWLAFEALRPVSLDDDRFAEHLVSYAKLVEYALLAPAVAVIVRGALALHVVCASFVLWGAAAAAVAAAQFAGLDVFEGWPEGMRQPSFLGHHDMASLQALVLGLAAAAIVAGAARVPAGRLVALALGAGIVGLVLSGSVTAAGGLAVGACVLWVAARRRYRPSALRTLALAGVVAIVAVGIATLRSGDLADFFRFAESQTAQGSSGEASEDVESYSQRTVLAYIGLRIFADHPLAGVGWLRSSRPAAFEPYLDDARARFPEVADIAFPAVGREWGVQNLYVQMLADAGIVGLGLLLTVGVAGLLLMWRSARLAPDLFSTGTGLMPLLAFTSVAAIWASYGIVAGIPLQAATSLLLGLAAAGAAEAAARADTGSTAR